MLTRPAPLEHLLAMDREPIRVGDVTETWRAKQDKNRFVSMMAYELKSPLSAIINYLSVILTVRIAASGPSWEVVAVDTGSGMNDAEQSRPDAGATFTVAFPRESR